MSKELITRLHLTANAIDNWTPDEPMDQALKDVVVLLDEAADALEAYEDEDGVE